MKKLTKILTTAALSSLCACTFLTPAMAVSAGDQLVTDGTFAGDIWADGAVWSVDDSTWTAVGPNGTVSWKNDCGHADSTSINYWFEDNAPGGNLIMSQNIASLPAGKYTLSAALMGDDGLCTMTVSVAGNTTEGLKTAGWENWNTVSTDFEIAEDQSSTPITITISGSATGWGYIDDISLVYNGPLDSVPDTAQPSGDFAPYAVLLLAMSASLGIMLFSKKKA